MEKQKTLFKQNWTLLLAESVTQLQLMISDTGPCLLGLMENSNTLLWSLWHRTSSWTPITPPRAGSFSQGHQCVQISIKISAAGAGEGFNAVPIILVESSGPQGTSCMAPGTTSVLPRGALPPAHCGAALGCTLRWAHVGHGQLPPRVCHLQQPPEATKGWCNERPALALVPKEMHSVELQARLAGREGEEEEALVLWITHHILLNTVLQNMYQKWWLGEANLKHFTLKNTGLACKEVYLDWEEVCEVLYFCWTAGNAVSKGWLLK